MPKENIQAFYRIKSEIEALTDDLGELEEEIGNLIPTKLQNKLRKLVHGYMDRLELGYQMMVEFEACDEIEKSQLNAFFADLDEQ